MTDRSKPDQDQDQDDHRYWHACGVFFTTYEAWFEHLPSCEKTLVYKTR